MGFKWIFVIVAMALVMAVPVMAKDKWQEQKSAIEAKAKEKIEQGKELRDSIKDDIEKAREEIKNRKEDVKEQIAGALDECKTLNDTKCVEAVKKRAAIIQELDRTIKDYKDNITMQVAQRARGREKLLELPEMKKFIAGPANKAREIVKKTFEKAQEKIGQGTKEIESKKAKFQEHASNMSVIKGKINQCKSDKECKELRKEVRNQGREAMLDASDATLAALERAKANIESESDLNEVEAQNSTIEIDLAISKVNAARAAVTNLSENATKEETKLALLNLKNAVQMAKSTLSGQEQKIVNARIVGVLVRTAQMESRLDSSIEKAQASGKNVTAVSGLVDIFHSQIEEAKTAYDAMIKNNDKKQLAVVKAKINAAKETLKKIVAQSKKDGIEVGQ